MNKKDLEQIRELIREELASKSKCTVIEKDIEPKFEIEKWYKSEYTDAMLFQFENGRGYGVDDNEWRSNDPMHNNNKAWTEASKKEVEKMLIKEAKRRGFKEGVKFKSVNGHPFTLDECWFSDLDSYTMWSSGCGIIFKNGKWAEIIENKLKINGKEVKIEKDRITIGCVESGLGSFGSMVQELEHWGVDTIHHSEIGDVKVKDLKDLL